MNNRIEVGYTVPVQVIVNLDTGKVERVVVLDESIRPDSRVIAVDADTHESLAADDPRVVDAYTVAGMADDWPLWAFGW